MFEHFANPEHVLDFTVPAERADLALKEWRKRWEYDAMGKTDVEMTIHGGLGGLASWMLSTLPAGTYRCTCGHRFHAGACMVVGCSCVVRTSGESGC